MHARYASKLSSEIRTATPSTISLSTLVNFRDEQNMGIHLQGLAMKTDTHGQYKRIGEIYGFPISIISERNFVDGKETVQNRFVVEGNLKYKFNNGFIRNVRHPCRLHELRQRTGEDTRHHRPV